MRLLSDGKQKDFVDDTCSHSYLDIQEYRGSTTYGKMTYSQLNLFDFTQGLHLPKKKERVLLFHILGSGYRMVNLTSRRIGTTLHLWNRVDPSVFYRYRNIGK